MKKWFISDTHFSHTNIIRYTGRPFETVEEMNLCLIKNWNDCIDADDQVFFLGDFGLGDVDHLHSICSQLKGHKICMRGNHDRNASYMMRVGFSTVLESAFLKIGQHTVELIHIPSNEAPSHFQLHGHIHEKRPSKIISNQLNLCVEVWDYKPVAEKTILSLLDKASKNEISSTGSNSGVRPDPTIYFLSFFWKSLIITGIFCCKKLKNQIKVKEDSL